MADSTYVDGSTLLTADTMNDLNRLHYTILSDPADAPAVRTAIAAQPLDAQLTDIAGLTPAASKVIVGDGANFVTTTLYNKVVQQVNVQSAAVATGTTVIPLDDTIPQKTEGNEWMTLAITPTSATNILEITAVVVMATSATGVNGLIAALFQDATAGALAASIQYVPAATAPVAVVLKHRMLAGTTSATTFKINGGCNSAGTTTLNGYSGGRIFGGVCASSITITEIVP